MKCLKPDYYDKFHCLASSCPDNCCQQWDIDLDPETVRYYKRLAGPLGDQIRRNMKETEDGGIMTLKDGRCPMFRTDGLCEIQAQLGHSALSAVCQEFPRLHHDYGSFMELGLELSCPEAARLILSAPWSVRSADIPGGTDPEYDQELMNTLLRTRRDFFQYLDTASLPLPQILAVLLIFGYEVQSEIDGGESAELTPEANLHDAAQYAAVPDFSAVIEFFLSLEILTPQWEALLKDVTSESCWNPCHKALLRYLVGRYWLQAVSDYDLVSRIKFMIVSCILVSHLKGDTIAAAQLFSKEIENDVDNVDAILDACYTSPAFTDVNLLSLLLHQTQ